MRDDLDRVRAGQLDDLPDGGRMVEDRPVLGGNGSSEIRVWSQGGTTMGKYPKLGEIVEEFADSATASPGKGEEFGDGKKEAIVRAEKNISLVNADGPCLKKGGGVRSSVPSCVTTTSEFSR